MMTSTGRQLTVVGYRPGASREIDRLKAENARLRREAQMERRKRMESYERTLAEDARSRRWLRDHKAEIIGALCMWHTLELMVILAASAWLLCEFM